jgi:hypothetical protein
MSSGAGKLTSAGWCWTVRGGAGWYWAALAGAGRRGAGQCGAMRPQPMWGDAALVGRRGASRYGAATVVVVGRRDPSDLWRSGGAWVALDRWWWLPAVQMRRDPWRSSGAQGSRGDPAGRGVVMEIWRAPAVVVAARRPCPCLADRRRERRRRERRGGTRPRERE